VDAVPGDYEALVFQDSVTGQGGIRLHNASTSKPATVEVQVRVFGPLDTRVHRWRDRKTVTVNPNQATSVPWDIPFSQFVDEKVAKLRHTYQIHVSASLVTAGGTVLQDHAAFPLTLAAREKDPPPPGLQTYEEEMGDLFMRYTYYRKDAPGLPDDAVSCSPPSLAVFPFGTVVLHGTLTVTHEQAGVVIREEHYEFGRPAGTWTTRDQGDRVVGVWTYTGGRLVEEVLTHQGGTTTKRSFASTGDGTTATGTLTKTSEDGLLLKVGFVDARWTGTSWTDEKRHGPSEEHHYSAFRVGDEERRCLVRSVRGAYDHGKEQGEWVTETWVPGPESRRRSSRSVAQWNQGHWTELVMTDYHRDGWVRRVVTSTLDWEAGAETERAIDYRADGTVESDVVTRRDRVGKETVERVR
jgi:hypothetical protein